MFDSSVLGYLDFDLLALFLEESGFEILVALPSLLSISDLLVAHIFGFFKAVFPLIGREFQVISLI